MSQPELTISVVIPTYNRAGMLPRCLRSALADIGPNDEVIVVDDGSTDDTPAVLAAFAAQIRVVHANRSGAGGARNVGIRASRKDLIAFLDSDDEWIAGRTDVYRCLFSAHPTVLFAFSEMAITTPEGEVVRKFLVNWHGDSRSWDEILAPGTSFSRTCTLPADWSDFQYHVGNLYYPLFFGLYVCTSTFVVRRVEAGPALAFGEDLVIYEDWVCFGRLATVGDCAFLDVETAWQHGDATGRVTDADTLDLTASRLAIIERVWAADPVFMAAHGETVRAEVRRQHRIRGSALLHTGDAVGARHHLALAGRVSPLLRVLAHLPGPLAKFLLGVRRRVLTPAG